jgi:hypothetical protein
MKRDTTREVQMGDDVGPGGVVDLQTRRRRQSLLLATYFYSVALVAVNTLLWVSSWNEKYVCR